MRLTAFEADEMVRDWALSRWERSPAGNLTRLLDRFRLTVFRRPWGGGFAFTLRDGREVMFSPGTYGTEGEAVDAVTDLARGMVHRPEGTGREEGGVR